MKTDLLITGLPRFLHSWLWLQWAHGTTLTLRKDEVPWWRGRASCLETKTFSIFFLFTPLAAAPLHVASRRQASHTHVEMWESVCTGFLRSSCPGSFPALSPMRWETWLIWEMILGLWISEDFRTMPGIAIPISECSPRFTMPWAPTLEGPNLDQLCLYSEGGNTWDHK